MSGKPSTTISFTERMNCPNLARAFEVLWPSSPSMERLDEGLWYIDREVQLREEWVRPLRFDTANGRPIGHLPEDDDYFHEHLEELSEDILEGKDRASILTCIWYADATNAGHRTLALTRELIHNQIRVLTEEGMGVTSDE